jgi:hypothetical protein
MPALIEPETWRATLLGPGGLPLDTTSSDVAVSGALEEAQELAEGFLGRFLAEGTYTETLRIYGGARMYPRGVPVSSVSDPAGATIEGYAVVVGQAWSSTAPWPAMGDPSAEVTYVGGYTSATLPAGLRRALCWAAYDLLHEGSSGLSNLPSGVNSVQVGDVSLSAGGSNNRGGGTLTASGGALSERARKMLKPWRRVTVTGW